MDTDPVAAVTAFHVVHLKIEGVTRQRPLEVFSVIANQTVARTGGASGRGVNGREVSRVNFHSARDRVHLVIVKLEGAPNSLLWHIPRHLRHLIWCHT